MLYILYLFGFQKLQDSLEECRPILEGLNQQGAQLANLSPREGATKIDELIAADNKKFEQAANQIQRRADKIKLQRAKSMEVNGKPKV